MTKQKKTVGNETSRETYWFFFDYMNQVSYTDFMKKQYDPITYDERLRRVFNNLTQEQFDLLLRMCETTIDELRSYGELTFSPDPNGGPPVITAYDEFDSLAAKIFLQVRRRKLLSFSQFKVLGKFCHYTLPDINDDDVKSFE